MVQSLHNKDSPRFYRFWIKIYIGIEINILYKIKLFFMKNLVV